MQILDAVGVPFVNGEINVCRIWYNRSDRKGGPRRVDALFSKHNQIQYEWGAIAAQCIGLGNSSYRVNAMYVEYENVSNPDDVITIPTFDRSEGRDYYQNLVFTSNRDFLRVPLLFQPTIGITPGFEPDFTLPNGNQLTFYTQTQGTAGFNGKPFNSGVNSKICGVALVATPNFSDPTMDLVFSRSYFDVEDQTPKLASSQVGVTWSISFE